MATFGGLGMSHENRELNDEEESAIERERKSRRWRDGAVGVVLVLLVLGYHFDLLEREPYPVLRSELKVEDTHSIFSSPRFRWLDNHRIVALVGERPDPQPSGRQRMIHAMKVWDVSTNEVHTLVADDVDALCLVDGYFRIMVRKSGPDGKEALEFYAGREGALQRVPPDRFDYMSCRPVSEVPLPEWTKSERDADVNIQRLNPEDGFLLIRRESRDSPAAGMVLHRPDGSSSDVSSILGDRPVKYPYIQPIYFEFKKAYLMHLVGSWLYRDGRVVQDEALSPKSLAIERSLSGDHLTPTASFSVFVARTFEPSLIGKQGLFEFIESDNHRRVVKGRIGRQREVSPDGCKLAFANDDRWNIDRDAPRNAFKLQIMNLCSKEATN